MKKLLLLCLLQLTSLTFAQDCGEAFVTEGDIGTVSFFLEQTLY